MSDSRADRSWIQGLLGYARTCGAVASEALVTDTVTHVATWQISAVTGAVVLAPRHTQTCAVRVFLDRGRVGTARGGVSTARGGVSGERQLRSLVDKAMTAGRKAEPHPYAAPAARFDVSTMGLGVFDRRSSPCGRCPIARSPRGSRQSRRRRIQSPSSNRHSFQRRNPAPPSRCR